MSVNLENLETAFCGTLCVYVSSTRSQRRPISAAMEVIPHSTLTHRLTFLLVRSAACRLAPLRLAPAVFLFDPPSRRPTMLSAAPTER